MSTDINREKLVNAIIVASPKRSLKQPKLCAVAFVPAVGQREILTVRARG